MQRNFANRCNSIWLALALVCSIAGCRVALVSDYDATTDQWITDLQQTLDAHLSTLESLSALTPGSALTAQCHPDRFVDAYRGIDARLRSLILRNEVRTKNAATLEQLRLLQSSIGKLKEQQTVRFSNAIATSAQDLPCLSLEQIRVNREILEQHIRAVLKLELSKRELREGG
jgi:hypothetical protein